MDRTFELGGPDDLGAQCLLINTAYTRATGESFAAIRRSLINLSSLCAHLSQKAIRSNDKAHTGSLYKRNTTTSLHENTPK